MDGVCYGYDGKLMKFKEKKKKYVGMQDYVIKDRTAETRRLKKKSEEEGYARRRQRIILLSKFIGRYG